MGIIIPDDPPSVDQTRDPAQDGQADVDKEIGAAPALEEDGQLEDLLVFRCHMIGEAKDETCRRDEDGDEVVNDIGR